MSQFLNDFTNAVKDIATEHDVIKHSKHKNRETIVLYVRNAIVCVATILFLVALFPVDHTGILRGCAYILGSLAYVSEIFLLTDFFSTKVPHREMFMIYCFAPLYIMMGISYFVNH